MKADEIAKVFLETYLQMIDAKKHRWSGWLDALADKAGGEIVKRWEDTEVEIIEQYQTHLDKYQAQLAMMREVLECYAAEDEWSDTVTVFLESGEEPDADGNAPEVEFDYDIGQNIVWKGHGNHGYDLAQEALSATPKRLLWAAEGSPVFADGKLLAVILPKEDSYDVPEPKLWHWGKEQLKKYGGPQVKVIVVAEEEKDEKESSGNPEYH